MKKTINKIKLECSHCGNLSPHEKVFEYSHPMYYDEVDDRKLFESFSWFLFSCGTCGGLNLYGDFFIQNHRHIPKQKLYPKGGDIQPAPHTVSPGNPIPKRIISIYQEVWPLRHRVPTAFIGQIRRLLEFVCKDQKAGGKDLYTKLKDLVNKGIFPGYFSKITSLLRIVGNLGAHASEEELTGWDAELIDEFFRSVIDYVYIAPARIKRMQERIKSRKL